MHGHTVRWISPEAWFPVASVFAGWLKQQPGLKRNTHPLDITGMTGTFFYFQKKKTKKKIVCLVIGNNRFRHGIYVLVGMSSSPSAKRFFFAFFFRENRPVSLAEFVSNIVWPLSCRCGMYGSVCRRTANLMLPGSSAIIKDYVKIERRQGTAKIIVYKFVRRRKAV